MDTPKILLLLSRPGPQKFWEGSQRKSTQDKIVEVDDPIKITLTNGIIIYPWTQKHPKSHGPIRKMILITIYFISIVTYHFSFFFVRPVYFFPSFFDSKAWSLHPNPPYQCPLLSCPFINSLWQKQHSLAIACYFEQYPHNIVIPLIFSWTATDSMMWQSSQLKHLPQHPYLYHRYDNFTCLHTPLFGSSLSVITCGVFSVGLYIFSPIKFMCIVWKQWWQFALTLYPGRYSRPLAI